MTENIDDIAFDEEYEEQSEVSHFKKRRASLTRPVEYKEMSQFSQQKFKNKRSLIAKRLSGKQRMPFDQLIYRNIHAGLDDELNERRLMDKAKKTLQLNRRLSHRPQPHEITHDDELPLDLKKADTEYYKLYHYRDSNDEDSDSESNERVAPRQHRTASDPLPPPNINKKLQTRSIENPLDWKFGQRSSSNELIIRGIIPEQYADVIHGDKSLEEAKKELQAYREESTIQVAKRLDLKLRPSRQDLQARGIVPDWENPNILQENKEKNTQALAMKYSQRMDPDEADQRAIINKEQLLSNKDYEEYRKEKKEENKKLKLRMRNSLNQRSEKDEIIFRGIVPREYLEQDVNIAKKQLKQQRNSIKAQMDSAFKARPTKQEMTKVYLKTSESDPLPPQPTEVNRNELKNIESPYAEYNGVLPTTPEYQEVNGDADDDDDNYAFPTFLDRLKAEKKETKKLLKKHMKRRSTIEELQKQGILPMHVPFGGGNDGDASNVSDDEEDDDEDDDDDDDVDDEEFVSFLDRMKNERKEHRKSIAEAHKRRPTVEELEDKGILLRGEHDYNPDVQQVYMSNEYAKALNNNKSTPGEDENNDEGSSSDDISDAFPTFLDRMREEKERTIRNLEMKHRRRPSQQDLEDRGVVEKGYFDNMQVALRNKKERRQSFTTELASFFTQRPDIAQMLTKGLVAAEFIGMDSVEMSQKRKGIKAILDRKLNKKRRPTMDDLEMRGIVPCGYFSNAQQAVTSKHTRRLTAEKDLANFLPKRLGPQFMLERGFIPKQQFEAIMGEQKMMNKEQQAFSAGAMGVAGVYGQKLVKETLKEENNESETQGAPNNDNNKRRNSKRISSGIGSIVLDVPQHAERNLFNHDNWTQNLYESLLNSLRFTQIIKRIESEKTNENMDTLASIVEKYEAFQRLHHTKMNGLQRDKKRILEEVEECDVKEKESVDILQNLIIEHSSLEQKIRPQMKMLLHKMSLVETRILNTKNQQLLAEYKKELNYYDTYCTELKNVFIMTNNIRSKYQNSIRTAMKHRDELSIKLTAKEEEIGVAKKELNNKFKEFHEWISEVSNNKAHGSGDNDNYTIEESKYDPLASDPVTNLKAVLDAKTKSIDNNLDLLSFRISTIPATDYALRVIELCQLSYIYSSDHLKSFFEWFIRFAVQTFVEITYAHTCFTTQNKNAIQHEINQLKSVQYITQLIPDQALFDGLTVIVSYLELLPSNNDDVASSNNNVDHEYVIFHVARYLTAHFTFSQSIISQTDEGDIPGIAQQKVNEWIAVVLQSNKSRFEFSKDFNQITNKQNRPRNIIKATKQDSTARVRPARAAAIVMDHVYGIHVDG